nr:microtubule-associated protein RP/EB family member 1-like [Nicotiana tomentosiformis]
MKPKPKKSAKITSEPTPTHVPSPLIPSIVPAPSSPAHAAPDIPTSTRPSSPKPSSHEPVSASTSKPTKIKATSRKSVKSDKVVIRVATKEDMVVKEVKLPPSKLDVQVSAIEVAPLEIIPPISDKPRVEEPTLETDTATQEKRVDTTNVIPMVEGEGDKEPVNKEAFDGEEEGGEVASCEEYQAQYMAHDTDEKKSENNGESREEKESEVEDKLGFDNYLKKKYPATDNDVDTKTVVTRKFSQMFELDAPQKVYKTDMTPFDKLLFHFVNSFIL